MRDAAAAIHAAVMAALPRDHPDPEIGRFYRLLREYPSRRGKMLRGRIVVASCLAHGGSADDAVPVAAGVELFQNWVLVHDDIEDDSDERRGRPTLHREIGVPLAINVGDALHVYMWDLLHNAHVAPDADRAVRAEFLDMIHRTAEGQHLDLSWVAQGRFDVGERAYLDMVELKTSHYTVVAPLRLGALCAGAAPSDELRAAGLDLGAAFQIRDDVLNLQPDRGRYGKEFAGDLREGKRTLILVHMLGHAPARERTDLIARLARPREQRTDDDVRALLEAIERHGSLAYAQRRAEELAASGIARLERALEGVADAAAAQALVAMAREMAAREA